MTNVAGPAVTTTMFVSLQALLRNVVPGSFPSQLSEQAMPGTGQRRFIVIDENIHTIYGARIARVSHGTPPLLLIVISINSFPALVGALHPRCFEEQHSVQAHLQHFLCVSLVAGRQA